MNADLATLLDREAIRDLRILYAQSLDSGDIGAMDQVFSDDAVVEITVGRMQGIAEIKTGLQQAFEQFDRDKRGRYPFLHAITNHRVQLTGADTAEGRCYLVDFETVSKPDPNPLLLLGVYADTYRRIGGQWRITHTTLEVVWPNEPAAAPGQADAGEPRA